MRRERDPSAVTVLDPDLLLRAYSIGVFPMADSRDAREVPCMTHEFGRILGRTRGLPAT